MEHLPAKTIDVNQSPVGINQKDVKSQQVNQAKIKSGGKVKISTMRSAKLKFVILYIGKFE